MFAISLIIAAIENFVLFSTFFALCAFGFALVLRKLTIWQKWQIKTEKVAFCYTLALIMPPLVSLWLVSAALLPRLWMTPEAFAAAHAPPLHEVHLLGALTLTLEPALAYTLSLFVVVIAGFVVWSNVRGAWLIGRVIRKLDMTADAPPVEQLNLVNELARKSGLSVGLVMSDYPLSFVWGFRRSKLVLSSGLLNTLSPVELTGVLEHEAAHHSRRDNLVKLLLSLSSYCSLAFPLSRLITGWRTTEVEMICDEVAAARTSQPIEIAEALIKLRRQTLVGPIVCEPMATPAIASSFYSDTALTFQRRVERLIALVDAPVSRPASEVSSYAISASLFVAGLLALSTTLLLEPLAIHHATETLIRMLSK